MALSIRRAYVYVSLSVPAIVIACNSWGNFWDVNTGKSSGSSTQNSQSNLADSGQTSCYDDGTTGVIACGGASYPGQDADYPNTPRARALAMPANAAFAADYTTYDGVTKLTWETCTQGLTGATCSSGSILTQTWSAATTTCATMNSANSGAGYGNLTTWRLPSVQELVSINNYQYTLSAIDASSFPGQPYQYWYWTTDVYNGGPNYYDTDPQYGYTRSNTVTSTADYVRCVAANTPLTYGPYSDHGDGTVTDQSTLLRWQKCSAGMTDAINCTGGATTATWQAALQYCDTLTLGNAGSRWRLPSVTELGSIQIRTTIGPAINASAFPNTQSNYYWTSTTDVSSSNGSVAWAGEFTDGTLNHYQTKSTAEYVRCVTGP